MLLSLAPQGQAAIEEAPYPPSPVISGITWDAPSTIVRQAGGSDNFPITWGADGHLYTAWGDGGGFGGGDAGLGVARLSGSPATFTGTNLWSVPRGYTGGKSYGILSVDGTLYMWAGPGSDWTGSTETWLMWSTNGGTSWQSSPIFFRYTDGFSLPAFLQFGRDYAGARDSYVYTYASDTSNGSNGPFTKINLARVPKTQITTRSAYEFFRGLDAQGNPLWTSDITQRQPVFSDPTHGVHLPAVSYISGINRYLLVVTHHPSSAGGWHANTGGLGIFDAPNPWGPWTTVEYVNNWLGSANIFFANIPTKTPDWLSTDGRTFHLVFTGYGNDPIAQDAYQHLRGVFNLRAVPAGPYPQSSLVQAITFDTATYFQRGNGSDQWPMTWASDGHIYAAWGDGNGWDEVTRYYMGVTQLAGTPPNLTGTDVWGGNDKNRKPSGLIADANQRMYLFYDTDADGWDGNYGMSSNDTGSAWTDTGTKVFSFANDSVNVVGIAQFGPGYTNLPSAVDSSYFYVYLASGYLPWPDGSFRGGDGSGKDIYLARVPKAQIFTRSAYTYFNGLDVSGNPVWSSNFSSKQRVFSDLNGLYWHANISWNPGLQRFIFAKGYGTSQLGIFESPNLWGPWGTVSYGPFRDGFWKFTYQLPQKWMSADGKTLWMAWSGWPEYDNVNFIKATLTLSVQDATPPSMPTALASPSQTDAAVTLTWSASTDAESGVAHYLVRRDGVQVGQVTGTTFTDTGLTEATGYRYTVIAVNGAGLNSTPSAALTATTRADTTPPTVVSVRAGVEATRVTVTFSEPMEAASATLPSHYTITSGVVVQTASLSTDGLVVTLTTTPHTEGGHDTLTVTGVKDRA
ncbi:MAG: hypothetical protein AAB281_01870, partial [Actinomycetota bacterium]